MPIFSYNHHFSHSHIYTIFFLVFVLFLLAAIITKSIFFLTLVHHHRHSTAKSDFCKLKIPKMTRDPFDGKIAKSFIIISTLSQDVFASSSQLFDSNMKWVNCVEKEEVGGEEGESMKIFSHYGWMIKKSEIQCDLPSLTSSFNDLLDEKSIFLIFKNCFPCLKLMPFPSS